MGSTHKRLSFQIALAVCVLGLAAIPAHAAFLIDDFNIPTIPVALVDIAGGGSATALHSADAYPSRLTTVTAGAGVLAATVGGGQIIDIQATAGGGVVTLNYYGASPDLTVGGLNSYLYVDIAQSVNVGALTLAFNVNSAGPATPIALPFGVITTPYTVGVPLALIAPAGDLASASFFDVFVTLTGGGTSITVDRVYTAAVPEVSSFLVMGLGGMFAVGAVWLGKRNGLLFKI